MISAISVKEIRAWHIHEEIIEPRPGQYALPTLAGSEEHAHASNPDGLTVNRVVKSQNRDLAAWF